MLNASRMIAMAAAAAAPALLSATANAGVRLVGGPSSSGPLNLVTGLSNSGAAIGNLSTDASPPEAYRWDLSSVEKLARPGGSNAIPFASAINNAGVVVGSDDSNDSVKRAPMRWSANFGSGGAVLPSTLAAGGHADYVNDSSYVAAINDSGMITGSILRRGAGDSFDGRVVVRWSDAGAAPVELHGLQLSSAAPMGLSYPSAQNDAGTIVGFSLKYDNSNRAFGPRTVLRWGANSTVPEVLGDVAEAMNSTDRDSRATAINASGTAVGVSGYDTYSTTLGWQLSRGWASRWDSGATAATTLDSLRRKSDGSGITIARSINDAGVAVGISPKYGETDAYLGQFAVRWPAGATAATELGLIGGSTVVAYADARAINRNGTTVGLCGTSASAPLQNRATLWMADQIAALDLNTLLGASADHWRLLTADRVSDTGWIAGSALYTPDGWTAPLSATYRYYNILVPQAGTYGRGDANFDTLTDFADLIILAQHYNESNTTQNTNVADFDLNGVTDFDDLVTLAQHYTSAGASIDALGSDAFVADWALAQSLVPEPVSVAVLALLPLGRRRR